VFTYYQYKQPPVFFNDTLVAQAKQTSYRAELETIEQAYHEASGARSAELIAAVRAENDGRAIEAVPDNGNIQRMDSLRTRYKQVLKTAVPAGESNDTNYIFLYYVTHQLPTGLVGLLIAVIILAAWGSIAAALNSLASSTVIDIHHKILNKNCDEATSYALSWQYTLGWGLFCIAVAMFATNMGSLIEAVNILGSIFYGVILGIFLVAFFIKKVKGQAVFWAAVLSELGVITVYNMEIVSFLWLNVVGAVLVVVLSGLFELAGQLRKPGTASNNS
jgi:Na+/proline symporter